MKKIFQMLNTGKITFIEVWQTFVSLGALIQGNVIESHYVLIVAQEPTHHIGIAISRN